MKKITTTLKVLAAFGVLVVLAGCGSLTDDSSSIIIIQSITGTTIGGDTVAYLQSDVAEDGGVSLDNATATIIVQLANPDPIMGPSQYNDVVLTNYRVTFELPAGGGTPGVDVPLPFDGYFSTVLCAVDKSTVVPFAVVLADAKLAAPLLGLATVLETRAKIEIFGHDLTDKAVSATGYLTIYFANYVD
jgi:hypothetical protein